MTHKLSFSFSSQRSSDSHFMIFLTKADLEESGSREKIQKFLDTPLSFQNFGFSAKRDQILFLPLKGGAKNLILLGWDGSQPEAFLNLRHLGCLLGRRLRELEGGSFSIQVPQGVPAKSFVTQLGYGLSLGLYDPKQWVKEPLKSQSFSFEFLSEEGLEQACEELTQLEASLVWMRKLQDTPPNELHPVSLAQEVQKQFASRDNLDLKVFDEVEIEQMGFGAFEAVGRAGHHPSRCLQIHYRHPNAKKKVLLVGKALTFDSGGKDLKNSPHMIDMKYDMSGGALVLSVMDFLSQAKLPVDVMALVGAAENSIDSRSYNPNDILKSYNGKTIEVLNTDAEGRLVLADLLSYGEKTFAPHQILEFSTLTGAILSALGGSAAGVFRNEKGDELIKDLQKASQKSQERIWELPIYSEFQEFMKGVFSDLQNIGPRGLAGSATAGAFLCEFVEKTPFVHFDIAGVAFGSKSRGYGPEQRGSTGFGLILLAEFLKDQSAS